MMKPAPTPSLKMPQPQFLLQFFVIALDDPTLLGQADQVLEFRLHRQGGQPILGGLGFTLPSVRPALMTMIGLFNETSRAAERNALASPMDSM